MKPRATRDWSRKEADVRFCFRWRDPLQKEQTDVIDLTTSLIRSTTSTNRLVGIQDVRFQLQRRINLPLTRTLPKYVPLVYSG